MKMFSILLCVYVISGCDTSEQVAMSQPKVESTMVEEKVVLAPAPSPTNSSPPIIRDEREGIIPLTIEIPSIGVEAEVEDVGLLENGQMAVPEGSENVAWFEPGPKPGEPGNSVIAGHVDDTVNPAVFYDLHKVQIGEHIYVTDQQGKRLTFLVRKKEIYPRTDAPLDDIFGFTYLSMLNLITCEGEYDPETTERAERLVVFAELVKN